MTASPSGARIWFMAARPRTLPAAVAPVLVGTALAGRDDEFRPLAFIAALLGAILIQVGTNLSNDYSDARRGADTDDRLGPVRVTAGGLVPPRQVLVATYVTFALRLVKASFNADEDGLAGLQQLAHDTNLLFYASDEAREGREAYKEKRAPDFTQFPRRP